MGDDENAAGRRLGGAYVKRLRMLDYAGPPKTTSEIKTASRPRPVNPGSVLASMVSVTWSPYWVGMVNFCTVSTPSCSDC